VLHEALTHVAHRRQPEPDRPVAHGEVAVRLVHVGHQHRDADLPAFVQIYRGLILVGLDAREQCGEILDRVVRLQVRGLVRNEAVPHGVRFVERVVGERLDDVEHLLAEVATVSLGDASLDELRTLLRDE
jgi:hypothetical protein